MMQDNKLTTVIIWVGLLIIFLLIALLALMGGVLYSKQQSSGMQVNMMPSFMSQAEQPTAPQQPAQQAPAQPAPVTAAAPVAASKPAAQPAAPAPKGEKIYVLINGKLVPIAVSEINQLAQEDQFAQQLKAAEQKAKTLAASRPVQIDEQTAKKVVAQEPGAAGRVRTGDGNKVVLTQAKYGRGLQSQLQMMGMAAADLIQREQADEGEPIKKLVSEAQEVKKTHRYVRVKPGDSLWSIAVRAYGNGFKYTRILEANPQIKNPDRLEAGMLLRVPL